MALTDVECREHEILERKDSGTESGFLEIEPDLEEDNDSYLPDMFEQLSPLEQRRQRGINDLINDDINFLQNFNNYVEDVKTLLIKLVFEGVFAQELEKFTNRLLLLQKCLADSNMDILEKRIKYAQPSIVQDTPAFYVDAVAALYKEKVQETLTALSNLGKEKLFCKFLEESDADDETSQIDDLFPTLYGLISYVREYLLDLQINMSYVLSCTPRKHKDYKPLREVVEGLKKYNQAIILEKSSRKDVTSSMKARDNCKNQKLRRRFSWDNSSFRAFAQLSRTFSLNSTTLSQQNQDKQTPGKSQNKSASPSTQTLKNSTFSLWSRRGDASFSQSLPRKFTLKEFRSISNNRQSKSRNSDAVKDRKNRFGSQTNPPDSQGSVRQNVPMKDILQSVPEAQPNGKCCANETGNTVLPQFDSLHVNGISYNRERSKSERTENNSAPARTAEQNMKRLSRSVEDLAGQNRRRHRGRRGDALHSGDDGCCKTNGIFYIDSEEDEDSILDKQIGISLAEFEISPEGGKNGTNPLCNNQNKLQYELKKDNCLSSCEDYNHHKLSTSLRSPGLDVSWKSSQSPADLSSFSNSNINSLQGDDGENTQESPNDFVCKSQLDKQVTVSSASSYNTSFSDCLNGACNTRSDLDVHTELTPVVESASEPTLKPKSTPSASRIQQKLREKRKRHASLSDMFKAIAPNALLTVRQNDRVDSLRSKQNNVRVERTPDLTISNHFNRKVRDLLQYSSQEAGSSGVVSIDDSFVRSEPARYSPLTSSSTGNMGKFTLTRETSRHQVYGRSVTLAPNIEYRRENSLVDMKVKTPGTYRRHTVSTAENSSLEIRRILSKKSRPSQAEIRRWSDGIDCLLTDQRGIEIFRIFLRSEFSEENVLFWLACEELKQTRTYKLPIKARKIFKTFIEIDSPYEVNIDHETRSQLEECMKTPTRTMFDQAQRRIRYLMANDSYPRFLKSVFYAELTK